MRVALFSVFIFSFTLNSSAQFPAQKVLIEVATGTWCASCPTAVQMIDKLHEEGYEIAVVKYHDNDPYENEASIFRNTFYDIQFFPTIHVDGTQLSPWNSYQQLESLYQDAIENERDYQIELSSDWLEEDSMMVRAVITKNSETVAADHRFFMAVTESKIPDVWHGQTEVSYAERLLLPVKEGMELSFESDSKIVQEFSFSISAEWNKDHLEFVAFVQDIETKEVRQATFFSSNQVFIQEHEKIAIAVYPNPASKFIKISGYRDEGFIRIFNPTGKEIVAALLQDEESIVDVSNISPGLYIIKGQAGNQHFQKKVLIK
ncbi:MAG TPA: T9SS type A sorting domain-containing protein [Bacteroidales bacterium]|nr:T9SS type A sorting domain-containing protein [Bacteroidales bacterium]